MLLMTVSGIGANTARMIMSAYSASEIRQIIATGNSRALAQVKGLGPKTAQRIIVDLKDKVLKIENTVYVSASFFEEVFGWYFATANHMLLDDTYFFCFYY